MIRGTTSLLGLSIKIRTKHNKGTTLCWGGGGGVNGEVVPVPLFLFFYFSTLPLLKIYIPFKLLDRHTPKSSTTLPKMSHLHSPYFEYVFIFHNPVLWFKIICVVFLCSRLKRFRNLRLTEGSLPLQISSCAVSTKFYGTHVTTLFIIFSY